MAYEKKVFASPKKRSPGRSLSPASLGSLPAVSPLRSTSPNPPKSKKPTSEVTRIKQLKDKYAYMHPGVPEYSRLLIITLPA